MLASCACKPNLPWTFSSGEASAGNNGILDLINKYTDEDILLKTMLNYDSCFTHKR